MSEPQASGRSDPGETAHRAEEPADGRPEDRFQSIVERVRDVAIFIVDPSGTIRSWNIGAAQLTGYRRSEILGRHVSVLYPGGEHAGSGPAQRWPAEPKRRRFEEETWIARKDGTRFWADVRTDGTLRVVRELGARSGMFVPLIARGRTLGALGFIYSDSGRRYEETDLEFAEELAGRAALFIDNAWLFQGEQEAVSTVDARSNQVFGDRKAYG